MTRLAGTVSLLALVAALGAGTALADTKDKKIALSNNYAGNSWRQAMLRSWDKVTKPAVEAGIVAAADPFTTAENQVTEQAAQIQNLVLQGYNAIVLNAASPDALNGAVKEACDAGVTGDQGLLIMRPEDLHLSAGQPDGRQHIPGTIARRQYLGSRTSYKVQLRDGQFINVDLHGEGHDSFPTDSAVFVGIEVRNARVIAP